MPDDFVFRRIDDYRWELPVDFQVGMRVPGRVYADAKLLAAIVRDGSFRQLANAAALPGIVGASLAMPDMHYGYGLPIGGVVATRVSDGVISPGATGYDINCGVRLIRTDLTRADLPPERLQRLVDVLFAEIPSGVGSCGRLRLSSGQVRRVLAEGARWVIEQGLGEALDLEYTEDGGCLAGADAQAVSRRAHERGAGQLGTLGSGNHFLELQYVQEIYQAEAARVLGLAKDQVTIMIHSGSRGLGHQVCSDYLRLMGEAVRKYGIELPDRQLACAPFDSPEGRRYLAAMRAAANYAWANRQCLMYWTGKVLEKVLGLSPRRLGFSLVYDLAHNIVKVERHLVGGQQLVLAVHRKGATRAFAPGNSQLPAAYRRIGQPVLIPGDMGDCSYLLLGSRAAMEETFGSTCHGAGRRLSRAEAVRRSRGRCLTRELEDRGVLVRCAGSRSLQEEMPEAYKDVSQVVEVVQRAGISARVARLRPLAVIKG